MPGGVLLLPVLLLMAGMLLEGEPTHMPCALLRWTRSTQTSSVRPIQGYPGSRRCTRRSPGAGWC
jgi:hypothetical protein